MEQCKSRGGGTDTRKTIVRKIVSKVTIIFGLQGMGVPLDEHGANKTKVELERLRTDVPLARSDSTVGNVVYSVAGFLLGGVLLFVSLFDPTRKPVKVLRPCLW
ncbi:uncharacterized protein [Procambarus clarkii]|uniref:uncharacterized protein isoform X2 n=1 Tax=Procambarus clarkii TaxID=6728 RepID=UPI0037446B21